MLVERRPPDREAEDLEREINSRFQEMLRQGRLVANGRPASGAAGTTVIDRDFWSSSIETDWDKSAVTADQHDGRSAFHDVRVFPAALGPTRVGVLAGLTLVEAVKKHVLGDPEVVALSVEAIAIDPGLGRIFKCGHWNTGGTSLWPLALFNLPADFDENHILFEWPLGHREDPPEAFVALRTLENRFEWLLKSLRDGWLALEGLPVRAGDPVRVPRSVWSHHDFSLDLERGNLFEENDRPEHDWDHKIKRWSALMICRGDMSVVPEIRALEPSRHLISHEMVTAPPRTRRSSPQPKSDGVRTALKRAGIDLETDPRSASAIAADIVHLLPWFVSEGHQLAALVKIVSRLRRQRD